MIELPLTAFTAAVFALMMVPLSLQISIKRVQLGGVAFGEAENETLRRRVRAHGNFIENAPLGLIVLGLVEATGAPDWLTWSVAGLLLAGRVLHAGVMLYTKGPTFRAIVMIMTFYVFLASGAWLLVFVSV